MATILYFPSEEGYTYDTGYNCRWVLTVNQNEAGNTSSVSAQFQTKRYNVNYNHRFTTILTVGDQTVTYRIPIGTALTSSKGTKDTWNSFGSAITTTVQHNEDGTGSLRWKFSDSADGYGAFGVSCAYSGGSYTRKIVADDLETEIALPTIARASTISSASSNVTTGDAAVISVTRQNTSYWHKATFSYNDTVLAVSDPFETGLTYTVPDSWMQADTTSASIPVTVSVQTYADSTCSETRGNPVTATFTVTAAASIAPVITGAVLSAADSVSCTTAFVKGYSSVLAEITANADSCQGATISSYGLTVQGVTTSGTESITSTNKVTTSGTLSVTVTATDTRGRSTSVTQNITVLDYASPTISSVSIFRCDESGTASDDDNYISLKATSTVSGLDGTNTGTLTAEINGNSYTIASGTATVVGLYDPDVTYSVTISLTDTVGNGATFSKTLPTRAWALNFAATGNGAAFGMACEQTQALAIPAAWDYYKGKRKLSAADVDAAAVTHTHTMSDIDGTVPVTKGGTGAATESDARTNLGIMSGTSLPASGEEGQIFLLYSE